MLIICVEIKSRTKYRKNVKTENRSTLCKFIVNRSGLLFDDRLWYIKDMYFKFLRNHWNWQGPVLANKTSDNVDW
jgi:hypothetical protein